MTAIAAVVVTSGRRRAEESTYGLSVAAPRVLWARSRVLGVGPGRAGQQPPRERAIRGMAQHADDVNADGPGVTRDRKLRCSGVMKPRSDCGQP